MTTDSLNNAIARLEAIDPNAEFAYEEAVLSFLTIKKLPVMLYEFPAGTRICRSRTHGKEQDEPTFYEKVSDISAPPAKSVSSFARCNRPFQSKFYGGDSRPTAYAELVESWAIDKKIGDKLYVTTGLWTTKKPLHAIIVTSPDMAEREFEYDQFHGEGVDHFISEQEGDFKNAMIEFYRFLFRKFRKSAKGDPLTYIIASAYCNLSLTQGRKEQNCIAYPSVPFMGEGINYCISADFVSDGGMELHNAKCTELTVGEAEEKGKFSFRETKSWDATSILPLENKITW